MPKTRFNHFSAAVVAMSVHKRAVYAEYFASLDNPLLQAIGAELIAANAVEAAELAEIGTELVREQIADMNAASAGLPAPGTTE